MTRPSSRNHRRSRINFNSDHQRQNSPHEETSLSWLFSAKTFIPLSCILVAFFMSYQGYLETRINTPFNKVSVIQKTGLDVPDRYWGSYRPYVYFGMKTRHPHSVVFGLMWYFPEYGYRLEDIRYWCEQNDYMYGYMWHEHDGRNYGIQVINDSNIIITTSFVKKLKGAYGGDWTARISFQSNFPPEFSPEVALVFYTAMDNQTEGFLKPIINGDGQIIGVSGNADSLGDFEMKFRNSTSSEVAPEVRYTSTRCDSLASIKESIFKLIPVENYETSQLMTVFSFTSDRQSKPNLIATEVSFKKMPFELEVHFESGNAVRLEPLTGTYYTDEMEKHRKLFHKKFESLFGLRKKGFTDKEIAFAKAALSNLIGGIGYFYGASRVLSEHTNFPVPYWKAALYTAVPSRSHFPRGFLWDEGFHVLLIAVWDLDIALDIIGHWFDLMNIEGWIPREQILGAEALKRVPAEFVTQINSNANPPVFFLTLQFILRNYEEQLFGQVNRLETLHRLYPRLIAWFDWFNGTQTGPLPGTYRWKGRDGNVTVELNPKTLSSGMDDYPRASHPTDDERHVDLRCWMAMSASALVSISKLLNKPYKRFEETSNYLNDNSLLDRYHWSDRENMYADYGLHTDRIILGAEASRSTSKRYRTHPNDRIVLENPTLRFVESAFGYNSLFPLILQVLRPDSDKLGKLLDKLRDPALLWTPFGLRSLSASSPFYAKRNTKDDPPYWRGNIWINMNYLVIRALFYYSKIAGPHNEQARVLYNDLRNNVIRNIYKNFESNGYLWENYNDQTGEGKGCKPFTGWTSLVVLMMAEIY